MAAGKAQFYPRKRQPVYPVCCHGCVPAAGKADGHVLLDLNKEEDNYGQADVPIAIVPSTDEIVLLQMDGNMTREEFDKAISMAVNACHEVYDIQKDALKRRYSVQKGGESNE